MPSLNSRIKELEKSDGSGNSDVRFDLHFIRPGHLAAPIDFVECQEGRRWTALVGESEAELIARAWKEASPGTKMLFVIH